MKRRIRNGLSLYVTYLLKRPNVTADLLIQNFSMKIIVAPFVFNIYWLPIKGNLFLLPGVLVVGRVFKYWTESRDSCISSPPVGRLNFLSNEGQNSVSDVVVTAVGKQWQVYWCCFSKVAIIFSVFFLLKRRNNFLWAQNSLQYTIIQKEWRWTNLTHQDGFFISCLAAQWEGSQYNSAKRREKRRP